LAVVSSTAITFSGAKVSGNGVSIFSKLALLTVTANKKNKEAIAVPSKLKTFTGVSCVINYLGNGQSLIFRAIPSAILGPVTKCHFCPKQACLVKFPKKFLRLPFR
jgi:hypothetical protein